MASISREESARVKPGHYCYRCEDLGIAGSEWQWEKPLSNWICSNLSQHDRLPGDRGLTSEVSDPGETWQIAKPKKARLDLYRIPPKEDAQPWPLYYLDPGHQVLITPDGQSQALDTTAIVPLLEMVARDPKQRVLVVGGDDATNSLKREWCGQAARAGWEVIDQHKDRKLLLFKRAGQQVNMYASALWFSHIPDADTLKAAYEQLENLLRMQFNLKSYHLVSTPTKAGKDLLLHSLPFEKVYPALPEAERELLYTIGYQGRMETIKLPTRVSIDDLYCLDGTFMYAACVAHLPVGEFLHDKPGDTAPRSEDRYIPGFYRATFRIPDDWAHIGLIKTSKERYESPDSQRYPNKPGMLITNWVSYEELYLAQSQGWEVTVHERLIFPDTHRITDPLATWIKHLRQIREAAKRGAYGRLSSYIADGDRAITLGTVGTFNRHQVVERHTVTYAEAGRIPAGVQALPQPYGIDYWLPKRLAATKWSHPEWALTAWGRARAKLARVALQLPYDSLLALRTDGIWTNARPGAYDNRDKLIADDDPERAKKLLTPGSWRVKNEYHASKAAPDSNAAMVSLIQELRATQEDQVAEFETDTEGDEE
jgi:DNA polymerase type B, organellar and viral